MSVSTDPVYLTPPQVAKRLRVSPERIIGWILAGELKGVDLASKGSKRPRYRVSEDALEEFLDRRVAGVPAPRRTPRRRNTSPRTFY